MAITLYQYPGGDGISSISPPCVRVDLALRWLGVDYEVRNLRRRGEVAQVSRTGRLPVLERDGESFVESTRILDALEQRHDAPWRVDTEREALQVRLWEHAVNDHYYWCAYYLRWIDPDGRRRFLDALLGRRDWLTRLVVRRTVVPKQIRRGMVHGCGGRPRDDVLADIERGLDGAVTSIGDGPFLDGRDTPTRADLTVTSLFAQAGFRDSMPEVTRMIW